jgi:hypothetical protein
MFEGYAFGVTDRYAFLSIDIDVRLRVSLVRGE